MVGGFNVFSLVEGGDFNQIIMSGISFNQSSEKTMTFAKYKFYAVKVYENAKGQMKSTVILSDDGSPVLFETNNLTYKNIEKMVESKAQPKIKGFPNKTSLFSLHTKVKFEDDEWVSDGEQYVYRGIGYNGVWSLNGL